MLNTKRQTMYDTLHLAYIYIYITHKSNNKIANCLLTSSPPRPQRAQLLDSHAQTRDNARGDSGHVGGSGGAGGSGGGDGDGGSGVDGCGTMAVRYALRRH